MKYPLEDLLRVRRFREDEAQSQLTAARGQLEAAEAALDQAEQALAEYIQRRERREAELYDEIMLQEVSMKDLDDLKAAIATLREQQSGYEERVRQAHQDVAAATNALEAARQAYTEAVKNRRKIDEHKGLWTQQEHKRSEAEAEKEMEDFRVRADDE